MKKEVIYRAKMITYSDQMIYRELSPIKQKRITNNSPNHFVDEEIRLALKKK